MKSLKSAGTPVDGIGLQAHFIVGSLPGGILQNMQAMTALGVEVSDTTCTEGLLLTSNRNTGRHYGTGYSHDLAFDITTFANTVSKLPIGDRNLQTSCRLHRCNDLGLH